MIIAVDGPAASGKGTIARALAVHFGLPYLDTGLLYRAVGLSVMRGGGDPGVEADALCGCAFDDAIFDDADIRSEAASRAASVVSAHSAVRAALLNRQRSFAARAGGAVLDGRDIGTVVAPNADVKLFVTATAAIRAMRRYKELLRNGQSAIFDDVLADINQRDARDAARLVAPLVRASDAALLDTSDVAIQDSIRQAVALVEARVTA